MRSGRQDPRRLRGKRRNFVNVPWENISENYLDQTLIWQLAYRYLRGKRQGNAVPILSRISMVAIAVSSAAMIIIFSVFNGIETIVKNNYKAFYPDLSITVARGKFFGMDAATLASVRQVSGVQHVSTVIEDNVIADNNGQQKVVTLKGIDKSYFDVNNIRDSITGDDSVSDGHPYTAIGGRQIFNELGADIENVFSYIELVYPNPTAVNPEADPLSAYQTLRLHPAGTFRIQDEFDDKYILAPLSLTQELFHAKGQYSSIQISTEPGSTEKVKATIQQMLGKGWVVATRYEQNKTLYMVMSGEKWAVYAILLLVLLIATFNMVGALSMLVLEKRKDIAILRAMGATAGTLMKIFLLEGMLWSVVGGVCGLALGIGVCMLQQHFGFVKISSGFLMDAYPVKIEAADIVLVMCTILAVGLAVSWYPATRATRAVDPALKSA